MHDLSLLNETTMHTLTLNIERINDASSHFSDSFFLPLIHVKSLGGFILPSVDVHDIIQATEKAFVLHLLVLITNAQPSHPK